MRSGTQGVGVGGAKRVGEGKVGSLFRFHELPHKNFDNYFE